MTSVSPPATASSFGQPARWRASREASVEADYRAWHRHEILPVARAVGFVAIVLWASIPFLFLLIVGNSPFALYISCWAISVPLIAATLVGSFTGLARWANEAVGILILVVGLNLIWVQSTMYGTVYGSVSLAGLAAVFFPLIIRIRTGVTAFIAVVLCGVPAILQVIGTIHGKVQLEDSWPFIAILMTQVPLVIIAAAQIEKGMRKQFAVQLQFQASQSLLRRYAPAAVARRIESGETEAVGHPQRLRVTAMSSDVSGFTALADRIDPESLSHIINEYIGAMSQIVESQHGVVTEFAGDGLTAIFGAPDQQEPTDQVHQALTSARAMQDRLAELNESWFQLGIEQPLKVRIGINTGVLSVGTFGSDGRATYTAIGLQMNVAARIQAQCEPGGILLSSASWHLVKNAVECDPLGEVSVKGVHFPISIYAPRTSGSRYVNS